MIAIGEKPILWHIMKIYAAYGHNDFIICLGYKGYVIKEYFINYFLHNSDLTVDLSDNSLIIHNKPQEEFRVTLVETGLDTMTAGRLKRVQEYVGNEEFMLTYGDGVSDVNINQLLDFHHKHGKIATMTSIQPGSRFGIMELDDNDTVTEFHEKPSEDGVWINGGFFVLKPEVFNYLHADSDDIMWERQPLDDLAKDRELVAYKHRGFWKAMDTLRDNVELNQMWEEKPKWKVW